MNVCVCVHNTVKKSQIIYVTVTLVTIIKKVLYMLLYGNELFNILFKMLPLLIHKFFLNFAIHAELYFKYYQIFMAL